MDQARFVVVAVIAGITCIACNLITGSEHLEVCAGGACAPVEAPRRSTETDPNEPMLGFDAAAAAPDAVSSDANSVDGGGADPGAVATLTPGSVRCDAISSCPTTAPICCVESHNVMGCVAENETCFGTRLRCDQAADCDDQNDQICCVGGAMVPGAAVCTKREDCIGNPPSTFVLCATDVECRANERCLPFAEPRGFFGCARVE